MPATCCVLTNEDPRYPQVKEENQCQIDAILYPDDIDSSEAVKTRVIFASYSISSQSISNESMNKIAYTYSNFKSHTKRVVITVMISNVYTIIFPLNSAF